MLVFSVRAEVKAEHNLVDSNWPTQNFHLHGYISNDCECAVVLILGYFIDYGDINLF